MENQITLFEEIKYPKKVKEINGLKKQVKMILTTYNMARDSDNELVILFWKSELRGRGYDLNELGVMEFFYLMNTQLSGYDSITRASRKVKEMNPNLRGESYARRKEIEREVTNTINI